MRPRLALAVAALAALPCVRVVCADAPSSADLVRALADEDVTKRYDAYSTLLSKRPPDALPLLARAVPGMPVSSQTFGFSIVQGYPPADTKPVFERWLASDAPYLQVAAGAALLRQGDAKAASTIAKALATPGIEPSTLSSMMIQLYGIRDAKVSAAVRAMVRPDAPIDVLGAALYQLTGATDEASTKAVAALLDAPSAGVRALAATFLLVLGDEEKAAPLATALATGEVAYAELIRVQNMLVNAKRCPDAVLDALVALATAETKLECRLLEIGLLGRFGSTKAVPLLKSLLDDENAALAKAAFEALSKVPGALTPDVTKSLLEAKDEARRVAAAEALRRGDDLSGLPALIDVLAHGKTARADAARALGAFRSRAAVKPLIDALGDADLSVRASAYNSLDSLLRLLFPYRRLDLGATGYTTTAAPDVRAAAVARIETWWNAHKDGSW